MACGCRKTLFREIRKNKIASGCVISDLLGSQGIFCPPNFRCLRPKASFSTPTPVIRNYLLPRAFRGVDLGSEASPSNRRDACGGSTHWRYCLGIWLHFYTADLPSTAQLADFNPTSPTKARLLTCDGVEQEVTHGMWEPGRSRSSGTTPSPSSRA